MNKTWIICGVCILLSGLLMAFGFAGPSGDTKTEKPLYAVIVTDDIGATVMQQKQGAQTAAAEFGAEIRTYTADPNTPLGPQVAAFLASAAKVGAKGALLTAPGGAQADLAQRETDALGIPLAVMSADAPEAAIRVTTDYPEQGRLLAESLLARGAGGPVAVLIESLDQAARGRLEGAAAPLEGLYTVHEAMPDDTLGALLASLPQGTRVLALTGPLTETAAGILKGRLALWGVDPGDARVPLLASGAAYGLVMEMPYAQGYLAVEALHAGNVGGTVYSPSRVVDRETMYLSENVKLMFPLLQ